MRLHVVTSISLKTVALAYLLLLTCLELARHSTNGAVTVSPSPVATVCNAREMLEVNCTTNASVLTWSLMYISENGMVEQVPDVIITSTTMIQPTRTINSSVVRFVRRSELRSTPLTSSISIASVSLNLNGTRITCRESFSTTTPGATTMIYIIPEAYDLAESLNNIMIVDSEGFGKDGVSVSLQWSNHDHTDNPRVSFNISTTPAVQPISISMTGATFTLAYNTFYNVSVVATVSDTDCDRILVIPFHYTKCVHPLDPSWTSVRNRRIDDFLMVTGYTDPAVEGDSVNLTCSVGVITGSTVTTCMQNGEWEPNPTTAMCISEGATSDEMLRTISDCENLEFNYTFCCERFESTISTSNSHPPLSEAGKIAVASISVFLVTFTLAFTVGLVTGHCCHKLKWKSSEPITLSRAPLYDTIHRQPGHSRQDVAMSENIAYSTVQPTIARAN